MNQRPLKTIRRPKALKRWSLVRRPLSGILRNKWSSMDRRSLRGLLRTKGLKNVFYGPNTFKRSYVDQWPFYYRRMTYMSFSVARSPWLYLLSAETIKGSFIEERHSSSRPKGLKEVFYGPKTLEVFCGSKISEVFCRPKDLRSLSSGLQYTGGLWEVFYGPRTFK